MDLATFWDKEISREAGESISKNIKERKKQIKITKIYLISQFVSVHAANI